MSLSLEETEFFLKSRVDELRALGVTEELFVAPVAEVKCFVACKPGECVCSPTIPGLCVVTRSGFDKSKQMLTNKLAYLKNLMDKK